MSAREGMVSKTKRGSPRFALKVGTVIVLLAAFTVFVLQNTEVVTITFMAWRVSVSRVLLLLGSLLVGCAAGILLGWMIFARKRQ
jgi:uncharacterized integral membrane protein